MRDERLFEERIEVFESEANEKYQSAIKDMQEVRLSDRFDRLVKHKLIPSLNQIGFDESLCWALFKMAVPAWELMGPISDKEIWFHPAIMKDIEEVRRGTLSKLGNDSEKRLLLSKLHPHNLLSLAKIGANPRHLFSLLENIPRSWIILPRVYEHLEARHSRYLLGYIKYLDGESNAEFVKILIRILIEYLGNFSLKYISKVQNKNQMIDVLFYGYSAMFWKNLRNPPNDFEHIGIYEYFLYWIKNFQKRFESTHPEFAKTVAIMEENKDKVFPSTNAFGLMQFQHVRSDRFLIALRHGFLGIDTAIEYFSVRPPLFINKTCGQLPISGVPASLNLLFQEIRKKYSSETLRTKENIQAFLFRLKTNFSLKLFNRICSESESPDQLKFMRLRVECLIDDLLKAMNSKEFTRSVPLNLIKIKGFS